MEGLRGRSNKTDLKKTFTSAQHIYPLCIHITTWLDKRGVSDSRYVIGKEKRITIMGLCQLHAAACRGGNMPTLLKSASVWPVRGHCAGQSCCILVQSHPFGFRSRTANIDRGTPHSAPIACCCSVNSVVASQRHLPGEMPDMLYAGRLGCPLTFT